VLKAPAPVYQPPPPTTFWTQKVIAKYSNIKSQYQLCQRGTRLNEDEVQMKNEYIIKKYEDIRGQLMKEANKEYYNCMQCQNENERISYDQYQEMLQHINYDVAW